MVMMLGLLGLWSMWVRVLAPRATKVLAIVPSGSGADLPESECHVSKSQESAYAQQLGRLWPWGHTTGSPGSGHGLLWAPIIATIPEKAALVARISVCANAND